MEIIKEYLIDEALVLIPALIILGEIIKGAEFIKNKYIPLALLFFGIVFSLALIGTNVDAVVQGVLVAGGAVFGHQLYKQSKEIE